MNFSFHTPDSPLANGRQPETGDLLFPLIFPTDEGGQVTVHMGKKGFVIVAACALRMLRNNQELQAEVDGIEIEIEEGGF